MLCRRSTVISWPGLLRIPSVNSAETGVQVTEQARSRGSAQRKVHLGGRCTCGIVIGRADVPGLSAQCHLWLVLTACILDSPSNFSGSQIVGGDESLDSVSPPLRLPYEKVVLSVRNEGASRHPRSISQSPCSRRRKSSPVEVNTSTNPRPGPSVSKRDLLVEQ